MLVLIFVGVNATNSTNDGCPENYYGNGFSDLLDRGWCDDLDEMSLPC